MIWDKFIINFKGKKINPSPKNETMQYRQKCGLNIV